MVDRVSTFDLRELEHFAALGNGIRHGSSDLAWKHMIYCRLNEMDLFLSAFRVWKGIHGIKQTAERSPKG